ncbi:uncharacterized protein LOC110836571 [Zootermopsis nevadensis]|uniref:CUB domain-containing protein n=1 Tax=Zootermopsis nevadensis TaxID=136037 RepID=A0A067QT51_ZOONE|nr:uncharacterized protein LOC110836571 [Zootermopsis nevadensis]KDR12057.1 hypothetical protein L798_13590 [Zootermopsis nevadensis]
MIMAYGLLLICITLQLVTSQARLEFADNSTNRDQRNILLYQSLFMPPRRHQPNSNTNSNMEEEGAATSRIENMACRALDGTTGLCYSKSECTELDGRSVGLCDDDTGEDGPICCIVEKSCRNITKQAISYFVNPSYPDRDRLGSFCDFRIDITNKNVCQVRLDLEEFSLLGPHTTMGICRSDRFVAMTSLPNGIGISELCGENAGQHLYVPVDATVGSASVSLMVMTSGAKAYQWHIRATQIDCRTTPELVAPNGCLQYHTDLSGNIRSFNYDPADSGHYQSNLDYAICIQRSPNTCRVEFNQVENSVFWINTADGMYLEEGVGRAGAAACDLSSHDYLYIPGGRDGSDGQPGGAFSEPTADKFCGRSLSGLAVTETADRMRSGYVLDPPDNNTLASTVTSYAAGPIVLRFHSDDIIEPDQELGFDIMYRQLGTGCIRSLK